MFDFGQKVDAHFACKEAANGPGITDCEGDAASGSPIDTSIPGADTFTVTAVSGDGQVVTETIDYAVRPDNRFTVTNVKARKSGSIGFQVKVPGDGRVVASGNVTKPAKAHVNLGNVTVKVGGAGTSSVAIVAGRKARQYLKAHPGARVEIAVTYTPTGGRPETVTLRGIHVG